MRCGCSCARCAACRSTSTGRRRSGCPDAGRGPDRAAAARTGSASSARGDASPEELIAAADVVCRRVGRPPSRPRGCVRTALASGTVPVASQLPLYEELAGDGRARAAVPARRRDHARGPARAADRRATACAGSSRARAGDAVPGWDAVVDQVEGIYRRLCARRHDPEGDPAVRRRISGRRQILVDLHMHTDHSPDCATPVEVLLATARDRGLGAIAITDHNEISGALAAARGRRGDGRHQGDRRRGGEDRRPGRGDRPVPRGEDPEGPDDGRTRSPRSGGRAGSSTSRTRSTACTRSPTTSTCSTWSRRSTSSRSSTRGSR